MLIPHVHTLHSCMISRPASSLPSLPVPPFPLGIGTSHHSNLYTFLQGFSFLPIPIHKFPVLSTSTVLLFINCSHTWLLMDINCEGRKKHPLIAPTPVCGGDAHDRSYSVLTPNLEVTYYHLWHMLLVTQTNTGKRGLGKGVNTRR